MTRMYCSPLWKRNILHLFWGQEKWRILCRLRNTEEYRFVTFLRALAMAVALIAVVRGWRGKVHPRKIGEAK